MSSVLAIDYRPRGAARDLFSRRDPELMLSGPAGTGKSRAALEKVHMALLKYSGARGLMMRKTRRSLTESGMVTYERRLQVSLDGIVWKNQQYQYPNGSILAVAGMDKAPKVMSSEWDMIYVQEATELTESEWEALTTRLRNGKMPYQQLIGDCNPDAPTHWLRRRMDRGQTVELTSTHADNPVLYDDKGILTDEGTRYLSTLASLTGVRYSRLNLGFWVAAEGMVYEDSWSRERNLLERPAVAKFPTLYGDCGIDRTWPRYMSIDFGYTNPFVAQWWTSDPDGRFYLYREIYMSRKLVEDHVAIMSHFAKWKLENGRLSLSSRDSDPLPRQIFCDHDAEGRATMERHLGWYTTPAEKSISDGIQAVASRLKNAGDSKPRLFILRDSTIERDAVLDSKRLPCSTAEEIEGYVWDVRGGRARGEEPLDANNHGMDAMRYQVATFDRRPSQTTVSTFKVF